ncbi:hypothetical protein ACVDG3_18780 [Meridianimarinicoccus sp. RP-17]|uniref:hypothetical protein n=1 Tax=Meridianimarinicoccus zhengii TaxID=2056810 RepID=UPI000DAC3CDD|nr:hypothetical protein [Phycocomes zhengii]
MPLKIQIFSNTEEPQFATRAAFHEEYADIAIAGVASPTDRDAVLVELDLEDGQAVFLTTHGYWRDEPHEGETEVEKLHVHRVEFYGWTDEPLAELADLASFAAHSSEHGYDPAAHPDYLVEAYKAACDAWHNDPSPDEDE